ncbi:ATP-grasp domain-containing protein [Undibacterium sp. Tian12W]|uniref:ATP-grasp domain-containing protein n=1 Tax=Undibacterium sp. Tian12W TaxID=3413054 RepID=UPI003BF08331
MSLGIGVSSQDERDALAMNLAFIEDKLFVASEQLGVAVYDFDFDLHFSCKHPYLIEEQYPCIMRVGAIANYAQEYEEKLKMGLQLVNTPDQHVLASELEAWYPLIAELTPRTIVYGELPSAQEIECNFDWPIFLKGSRQTSKHNPDLAVIQNRAHYEKAIHLYRNDAILHWQKPVIREFIPLAKVDATVPGKVQVSIEYRSFWWHGICVGWGRYWYQVHPYDCPDADIGLGIAAKTAARLSVPFLVIDFAKTADGRWIIIECNDAQESGYVGIQSLQLWQRLLAQID